MLGKLGTFSLGMGRYWYRYWHIGTILRYRQYWYRQPDTADTPADT